MLELYLLKFSSIVSLPVDIIKAAVVLLLAFPFAIILSKLPKKHETIKHLFSIISSCSLFCLLFPISGFIQLLFMALASYVITYYFRSTRLGPLMTFSLVMVQLSLNHFYTQILIKGSPVSFDYTAPMMVLVMKLSSFSWSAHDGYLIKNKKKSIDELTHEQKLYQIENMPSIIEFLGYVFFVVSFLVGPSMEYKDYEKYIKSEAPYDNIPNRTIPTLKKLLTAILCTYIYFKFGSSMHYNHVLDSWYIQLPFYKRILWLQFAGIVTRTKYYVAWKLAESACVLAGVSYGGNNNFDKLQNISILGLEFGQSPKGMLDNWNINTAHWLRRSVYMRLSVGKDGKPTTNAELITFMISAFWHGFRPGFYLTFFTGGVANSIGKKIRRKFRPLFLGTNKLHKFKIIYDLGGNILSQLTFNYLATPFCVHSLSSSLYAWRINYYYIHIGLLILWIYFTISPPPRKPISTSTSTMKKVIKEEVFEVIERKEIPSIEQLEKASIAIENVVLESVNEGVTNILPDQAISHKSLPKKTLHMKKS